jgi:phosphoribosylformimino-5-aminoimidazole carboxamide ribotide isomerase
MELGGGIRTLDTIAAYIDLGIDRLILGTVALKDPDLAARACADYPGRIIFGLDAKDGLLAVEGWTETSKMTALNAAQALAKLKPAALIYTDIARDGVKRGVNIPATGPGRGRGYPGDASGG